MSFLCRIHQNASPCYLLRRGEIFCDSGHTTHLPSQLYHAHALSPPASGSHLGTGWSQGSGGGHYRWPGWLDRINTSGLKRSMSRKGCSSDNAACEGFFGRVKNEMFYGRNWAGITLEKFICLLDRYIRWYNERRIKLSLGAMSPVKYRQHLGITT